MGLPPSPPPGISNTFGWGVWTFSGTTQCKKKIIGYLPDSARAVGINRACWYLSQALYTQSLFLPGPRKKDGLQHPLEAHMVGYLGKGQPLKEQIKMKQVYYLNSG